MSEFKIKEGSNRPWYVAVLREPERDPETGEVINPTNPTMLPINFKEKEIEKVQMILRGIQNADPEAPMLKVELELIGDEESGLVRYKWDAADTVGKSGKKNVEFELEFANTETTTIPEDGYESLTIVEDLDG